MTKRDLVAWLKDKQQEAVSKARAEGERRYDVCKENIYSEMGLDDYIHTMMKQLDTLNTTITKFVQANCNFETGVSYSQAYGSLRYIVNKYDNSFEGVKKLVADDLYLDRNKQLEQVYREARQLKANVANTYDVAIQTVKNLPTAKDGLEYLTNLGFNVSEITPKSKEGEMQLPATVSVNVDTRYLLIEKSN